MNEQAAMAREIDWVLGQVATTIGELPEEDLAWRPDAVEANDARTIATHILGATRSYALGLGFAQNVSRDRVAEFDADDVSPAVLLDGIALLRHELAQAASVPADLDLAVVVPAEWVGPAAEGSRRDALLEALRHASIHLGELRLVRDLAPGR